MYQKQNLLKSFLVRYQQALIILFSFVPDKQFGQIITIAPHSLTILKTNNAEFQSFEVCFTDQNNKPLEIDRR